MGGNEAQSFVGRDPNAGQAGGANRQNASNRGNRANRRNQGNARGGNNRGGNRNRGQFGGNQNFPQQGRRNQNGRNRQRRNVRPRQQVNFSFPKRTTVNVVGSLRTQFALHAERYPVLANVSVLELDGRIELYGTIDSEENRRLATLLAKLEPGVREVKNRMTVESP